MAAFLALGLGAAIAHRGVIEIRANHGFPTSVAFLVAGALLLPPELVALLAVAQYLPDVLLSRTSRSIQAFNISNGTLNVTAAWLAARAVTERARRGRGSIRPRRARRRPSCSSCSTTCSWPAS